MRSDPAGGPRFLPSRRCKPSRPISVQHLLPHGDSETVARECGKLVSILGAGGGYIAAPSHAIQVGTPPENVISMLRTLLCGDEFDRVMGESGL